MLKASYMEIFKDALRFTWANKYLWWFGFFIALSEIAISFNYSFDESDYIKAKFHHFLEAYSLTPLSFTLISLSVFAIFMLLFLTINAFGRGALIHSLNEISENRKANFKIGAQAGRKNFWKIFSILTIVGIFNMLAIAILFVPVIFLFFTGSYIIGTLLGIIAVIIILPLLFITTYLKIFGFLYVIAGKTSIWNALENAYDLLLKNLKSTITLILLLIVLNIILFFVFFFMLIPFIIFFLLLGAILFLVLPETGMIALATFAGGLFFIAFIAFKSIYDVFNQSVWLLFFRSIAKPEAPEKIFETEAEIKKIAEPSPIENI